MNSFLGNLVSISLSDLRGHKESLASYLFALDSALSDEPPPYSRQWFVDEFKRMGRDPAWFSELLISDADMEGYSAKQLMHFSKTIHDNSYSRLVSRHAEDESRHSRIFAGIFSRIYPYAYTDDVCKKLEQMASLSNSESANNNAGGTQEARTFEETLSATILINLFEVKALVLGHMLQPLVIAHSKPADKKSHKRLTEMLIKDEARHIHYTAMYIDKAISAGYRDLVLTSIIEFQKTLNSLTAADLEFTVSSFQKSKSCE